MSANWLRKVFGPRNSLVLCYDHLTEAGVGELDAQLTEVKPYYEFSKLSEIAQPGRSRRATGKAAIVFLQARRSVFLRAIPDLLARGIPFTLFLSPGYIGFNRLPFEEEVGIYHDSFSKELSDEDRLKTLHRGWTAPNERDAILGSYRSRFGPLPFNDLDPLRFSATWGQINEIPAGLMEAGYRLECDPSCQGETENAIAFVRQRCHLPVRVVYAPGNIQGAELLLKGFHFEAVLTTNEGPVIPTLSPMQLPQFSFERVTSA